MITIRRYSLWLLVTLLNPIPSDALAAEPPAYRTWAIVSSKTDATTLLGNLLTAELSNDESLRLVERDQIAAVNRELTLDAALSSDPKSRLKLGTQLGADALILLVDNNIDGKRVLRVVISECRWGARLAVAGFADAAANDPKLVEQIVALQRETRRRFSGGLRWSIGIPHFVSRSLTHQHDALQSALPALLESAIQQFPGAAVIESEEARFIGQELEMTGANVRDRVVSLFIEGEYEASLPDVKHEVKVDLSVTIRDGKTALAAFDQKGLSLAEAATFVSQTVADRIRVEVLKGGPKDLASFSVDQQVELLTQRAAAFARLGAWEHSSGLREAALLLKPKSIELELAAVDEHFAAMQGVAYNPGSKDYKDYVAKTREQKLADAQRCIQHWRIGVTHLENLLGSRKLSIEQGVPLAKLGLTFRRLFLGPKKANEADDEERIQHYVTDVYPLAMSLPSELSERGDWSRLRQQSAWTDNIIVFAGLDGQATYLVDDPTPVQALEFLGDYLVSKASGDAPPGAKLIKLAETDKPPLIQYSNLSPIAVARARQAYAPAYERFLSRLEASGKPNFVMTAKYARWVSAWHRVENDRDIDVRTRIGRLILEQTGEWEKNQQAAWALPAPQRLAQGRIASPFAAPVSRLRGQIIYRIRLEPTTQAMATTRATTQPFTKPAPPAVVASYIPIVFSIIPENRNPENRSAMRAATNLISSEHMVKIIPFSKDAELFWSEEWMAFHRTRGTLEMTALPPGFRYVDDVVWDGAHFWLASQISGLALMDTDGKFIASFDQKDGLPPADFGIRLWPLGVDRLFVAGSFSGQERAWSAIIERDGKALRVNVFHKATEIALPLPPSAVKRDAPSSAEAAYRPGYIHELLTPKGSPPGTRLLFMNRFSQDSAVATQPLIIDVNALKVYVGPRCYGGSSSDSVLSGPDGLLYTITGAGMSVCTPQPNPPYFQMSATRFDFEKIGPTYDSIHGEHLFLENGQIYIPTYTWFRLDLATHQAELLSAGYHDMFDGFTDPCLVSVHYGRIARHVSKHDSRIAAGGFYEMQLHDPPLIDHADETTKTKTRAISN